jgi:hypothetical protein
MNRRLLLPVPFLALVLCSTVALSGALSGCKGGNLFGGLTDNSSNIQSLLSDASKALRERNYGAAFSQYESVLAREPNNAQALYGAAAAQLGLAGFNFSAVISNVLSQNAVRSAAVPDGLADFIKIAHEGGVVSNQAAPASVLYGVNLQALRDALPTVLCRLQKIVSGATDGGVDRNNIDVLVNLGILHLLHGAVTALDDDFFDIVNENGDYRIIKNDAAWATLCSTNEADVREIVRDAADAYALFNRAATLLNLGDDKMISKIRDDVSTIAEILLDPANADALPAPCRTALADEGLTLSGYKNRLDVFSAPSGC